VFGDGDWGRWGETANDISLGQVIAQDPGRFVANWWSNVRGYAGTGGEDTREFGQAAQIRLLGFPANWLAIAGLLGWFLVALRLGDKETERQADKDRRNALLAMPPELRMCAPLMLIWVALYVAAISVGLALQMRFILPLAPIYALAAAWTVVRVRLADGRRPTTDDRRPTTDDRREARASMPRSAPLIMDMLLLALLWGGFRIGQEYVLRLRPTDESAAAQAENRPEQPGQPADEVGIIRLAQATLRPGQRLVVRVDPAVPIGKYSAIAHLTVPVPASDTVGALRGSGAQYLIWSTKLGPAPAVGAAVGSAGSYTLYRITE
jgi:hypothetical protein